MTAGELLARYVLRSFGSQSAPVSGARSTFETRSRAAPRRPTASKTVRSTMVCETLAVSTADAAERLLLHAGRFQVLARRSLQMSFGRSAPFAALRACCGGSLDGCYHAVAVKWAETGRAGAVLGQSNPMS
jgi:hypothetical protein